MENSHNLKSTHTLKSFHFGCPGGLITDKKLAKALAEMFNVEDSRYFTGKVNLFGTDELDECKKHGARVRVEFKKQTMVWDDAGYRLLANIHQTKFEKFENESRDDNGKLFQKAVSSILDRRPEVEARFSQSGLWGEYEHRYPTREKMERQYQCEFGDDILPDPEQDIRVGMPKAQHEKFMKRLIKKDRDLALRAALEVHQRCEEAAKHYVNKLENYTGKRKGSFHDTTVENLKMLAGLLKGMNVYNSPELDKIRQGIVRLTSKATGQELRDNPALRESQLKDAKDVLSRIGNLGAGIN